MKRIFSSAAKFTLMFVTFYVGCKDEPPIVPPTPPRPNASLLLQNKSCTELWLNLQLENFNFPVNVQLIKNNLLQLEIGGLSRNDTTIYIDSLLPNKIYDFIAVVTGNEQQDTSD